MVLKKRLKLWSIVCVEPCWIKYIVQPKTSKTKETIKIVSIKLDIETSLLQKVNVREAPRVATIMINTW